MKPTEKLPSSELSIEEKIDSLPPLPKFRIRLCIYAILGGFLLVVLGAKPEMFGLDRSPVVGFVQISVMLIGIGVICLSGYYITHALWRGVTPTITADIGVRLISTGFVIALFSGMADVLGVGSQSLPNVPFFGVWQARGMEIGLGVIAIGFIMTFPYQKPHR